MMGNKRNIPALHPQSRAEDTTSGGWRSLAEAVNTTDHQLPSRKDQCKPNQEQQAPRRIVNNARTPQPQTTLPSAADGASHSWPRPIGCRSTEKSRRANLSVFSNLRYQDRRSAGDAAAAACAELRARPQMTVTTTGPLIQISAVFPGARVRPAALDRRRIGCPATPPGVEPQGGHATDQTSHGCMMKPIGAASSAGQQPKQHRVIPQQLCVNE